MYHDLFFRAAVRLNRLMGRFRDVVWLVGDGRSGTTWAVDLINHDGHYRQMFEPFHPKVTPKLTFHDSWVFIRPDQERHELEPFARQVFEGRLLHRRVDRYPRRLRYGGLLIKDIFAHLLMKWVDTRFPNVKKVLLLRHPCAIAVSKEKLPRGRWMDDPRGFLKDEDLFQSFLRPHQEVIEAADTYFERQVTIWCILHSVVLTQMEPDRVHLLFYEELCRDFERAAEGLFRYLGRPWDGISANPEILKRIKTLSETTRRDSPLRANQDPVSAWRTAVSPDKQRSAGEILRAFGLEGIYDETGMPVRGAAEALLRS